MSRQYLNVPYAQKDEAKALGARWDPARKKWYAEEGLDLQLFHKWLPEEIALSPITQVAEAPAIYDLEPQDHQTPALPQAVTKGITLSQLMSQIAAAVAMACPYSQWVVIEIANVHTAGKGHVYLEVSERDAQGQLMAEARAMIWASTAQEILPAFEQATGVVLGAGIKLLVRVNVQFHVRFGLSLIVEEIDHNFTLGALEARKKEIRERLKKEGLFDLNRALPTPWDYRLVLVIAPHQAAGLGDFMKEADRLAALGICEFVYAYSVFQGEDAPSSIIAATQQALAHQLAERTPDAVVLIRGGGAVNDLAWLNDYELTRFLCMLEIPVLTGIGHERDSTLPDEVAHTRFDTPSKVILGIEKQIQVRALQAKETARQLFEHIGSLLFNAQQSIDEQQRQISLLAQHSLVRAHQLADTQKSEVEHFAIRQVHKADQECQLLQALIQQRALQQLTLLGTQIPYTLQQVLDTAGHILKRLSEESKAARDSVLSLSKNSLQRVSRAVPQTVQQLLWVAQQQAQRERSTIENALAETARQSQLLCVTAQDKTQALMREIIGQGPDKTLARGFTIVRDLEGNPLTNSRSAKTKTVLEIQFYDDRIQVKPASKT